jgi:hypothetical protein
MRMMLATGTFFVNFLQVKKVEKEEDDETQKETSAPAFTLCGWTQRGGRGLPRRPCGGGMAG